MTFDYHAVEENIWRDFPTLRKLPYDKMKSLLPKGIFTDHELSLIERYDHSRDKMTELLSLVLASLQQRQTEKYKGFLKALKESDDVTLKKAATRLGGWISNYCSHTFMM